MLSRSSLLAFFGGELLFSILIFSTAVALHSFNASILPHEVFGSSGLAWTLVPFSFGIFSAALSLASLRCVSAARKQVWSWSSSFLYLFTGGVAIAAGYVSLEFVDLLGRLANTKEGSAALYDETDDFEAVDERLLFFSDTLLGLYSGCCRTDFLKECPDFVYSAGVPYCYDRESHYVHGIELVSMAYNYSVCFNLDVEPVEFCPTNGTTGHDIPLFFKSVQRRLAFFWMPTGSVLIAAGFAATFFTLVYMCCLCKFAHSPNVSYSAADIDYGTPIKEPQRDLVVV